MSGYEETVSRNSLEIDASASARRQVLGWFTEHQSDVDVEVEARIKNVDQSKFESIRDMLSSGKV